MKMSNKKGFTLMEVIITIFVLGIIVIFFSSVFTNSIKLVKVNGDRSKALNEVRSNINESIAAQSESNDDSITLIFNEGEEDEETLIVSGDVIAQTVDFENIKNNSTISISYFKAVVLE